MSVAAVSGVVGAGSASGVDPTVTSDLDEFLTLLVEQLRGQDPLEPMDNESFVTQLVQFGSLQQMAELNSVISVLADAQKGSFATSLLGGDVEYVDEAGDLKRGQVTQVRLGVGNEPILVVGGSDVHLDQVTAVFRSAADA